MGYKKPIKKAHQLANSAVKAQKKMLLQKDKIKSQKAAKTKKAKKVTKAKTKKKTSGCKKAGVSCKLYDALKKKAGGVTKLKRKLVNVMRFDKSMRRASGKKVKGKTASMKVGKKAFYALA